MTSGYNKLSTTCPSGCGLQMHVQDIIHREIQQHYCSGFQIHSLLCSFAAEPWHVSLEEEGLWMATRGSQGGGRSRDGVSARQANRPKHCTRVVSGQAQLTPNADGGHRVNCLL